MSNHCIDCKFCGKDQRIVGQNCCPEYVAQQEKLAADTRAAHKAEEDYLSRFGLEPYDGKLYASDVMTMLKRREGKILKPGRRPKPTPITHFDD